MTGVVLFGIGSPIVVDFEESLHRAGLDIVAGIRNREGPSYLWETERVLSPGELEPEFLRAPYLVPLFTPAHRQTGAREAIQCGFTHAFILVDPTATLPRRLDLGPGSYVNAGCCLGGASRFGSFAFVNRSASIGHHCVCGDFVSIGPRAVIAGHVTIGTGSVIGTGATILPEVSIGANAVVGAGAVVTQDVPESCLVVGNPARITRRDIGGHKGLAAS